jgi:phosphoribosylglycinamide formyltransferase 2
VVTEETRVAESPDGAVEPPPTAPAPEPTDAVTVMVLGAGELGRELVTAFQRLGATVIAVDRHAEAPAFGIADQSVVAKINDTEELAALIGRTQPQYVVAESNAVAFDALAAAADSGFADVAPTARSARLGRDREGLRRLASDELGLPTAPFWFAGSVEELEAVAQHAGFPLVVKPVTAAPGDGESVLLRTDDIGPAWENAVAAGRLPQARVLVETMVEIDYEVTLLAVRSNGPGGGTLHFCEPIGHRQDGDVLESWQPQVMSPTALDAAKSIGARIVAALGGRGVYAVELFVRGDEVYFADVTARPYDSGLVTLRSQRLSEFELHARAILGLPVDTIMISPGAAEVIYTGTESLEEEDDRRTERTARALSEALAVPESDVRIFSHSDSYPRHRLAVALATASNVTTARERVRQVAGALREV